MYIELKSPVNHVYMFFYVNFRFSLKLDDKKAAFAESMMFNRIITAVIASAIVGLMSSLVTAMVFIMLKRRKSRK